MALAPTGHRPWPPPDRPWVMRQRWLDVLFAHWAVPAAAVRALVPEALELDTYDGRAWLGVVPFRMAGVRPRLVPPLPGLPAFPELNVRTYVTVGDKPGVYFFSLDAGSTVAVRVARRLFHLPYYDAAFALRRDSRGLRYGAERTHRGATAASLDLRYRAAGDAFTAEPGALDHWLTERYCLYAVDGDRVWRGEIHHAPWPLQPATAVFTRNTMAAAAGIELPDEAPALRFAAAIDVVVWPLQRL